MKNKPINLSSISQPEKIWIALNYFNENGICRMNFLKFLDQLAYIILSKQNNVLVVEKLFINQRFFIPDY
jgi:hypothetical protein